MRTLSYLLATGLASSLASAREALVYSLDQSPRAAQQGSKAPSISAENARLYFAQRLGLSQYHSLENADEATLQLLNMETQEQLLLFEQQAQDNGVWNTLIIVEGVGKDTMGSDIFGSEPTFKIASPPSYHSSQTLVRDLLAQDKERRGAQEDCDSGKVGDTALHEVNGGFSSNDPLGSCQVQMDSSMDGFEKFGAISKLPSTVMNSVYGQNLPVSRLEGVTSAFHISTLQNIANQYGQSSKEYNEAVGKLIAILRSLQERKDMEATVMLLPLLHKSEKRSENYGTSHGSASNVRARREAPLVDSPRNSAGMRRLQTLKASNSSTVPRTTIPSCYNSKANCESATSSCTGHGSCTKKFTEKASEDEEGAECWSCLCAASVTGEGNKKKTTYYGGPACQKKDVSVPFFLLAGFTIALVAALTWGVGLLYSVGEDKLPSVLGAGVPPTARK